LKHADRTLTEKAPDSVAPRFGQDADLNATLTVADLQNGFVGPTGTVWTVSPEGIFTVARQVGINAPAPHKTGQLTTEQKARLAGLIAAIEQASIPSRLGAAPGPNVHQITVSYGSTRSVLTLSPPAAEANEPARADPPTRLLVDLVAALKEMVGS
jgi:hypothetical protein